MAMYRKSKADASIQRTAWGARRAACRRGARGRRGPPVVRQRRLAEGSAPDAVSSSETMTCRVPTAPSRSRPGALVAGFATALFLQGCAPAPILAPPVLTFEEKMSWVLRLEDQRVLRDPAPLAGAGAGGQAPGVRPSSRRPCPDLLRLLSDREGRLRRRAALAIGRVGLADGVAPLVAALSGDAEPEVRQMAAFALGLLGDQEARAPCGPRSTDASPVVRAGRRRRCRSSATRRAPRRSAGWWPRRCKVGGGRRTSRPTTWRSRTRRRSRRSGSASWRLGASRRTTRWPASVLDASGQPAVRVVAGRGRVPADGGPPRARPAPRVRARRGTPSRGRSPRRGSAR